ncbi:MAG: glycosyltransferase family 2 protein, partial [Terriglobales bacterium]
MSPRLSPESSPRFSPRFSIVIPTWNGRDLLARHLPSVVAASAGCEIIISDDGSTDGTGAWLAQAFPQVRGVTSLRNRGFGPA